MKAVLDALQKLNVEYKLKEHEAVCTVEEADKFWTDIEGVHCKNLFLRDKKGKQHYLVVANKNTSVSIESLNQMLGNERLGFASERRLDKYLKLIRGAVSPFGIINDMDDHVILLIDQSLQKATMVSFHPNVNTATLSLSFLDFEKFLQQSGNAYRYIDFDSFQS